MWYLIIRDNSGGGDEEQSTTANKESNENNVIVPFNDNMWRLAWQTMLNCHHLCCPCKGEGRDYSRMWRSEVMFGELYCVSHDKESQIRVEGLLPLLMQ